MTLAKTISGNKAAYVVIAGKKYEQFAVEMGKHVDYLLVIGTDWKVIPLENMIAGLQGCQVKIISGVKSSDEAKLALATLEQGADGVLLDSSDLSEIKEGYEGSRAIGKRAPGPHTSQGGLGQAGGDGRPGLCGYRQHDGPRRGNAHRLRRRGGYSWCTASQRTAPMWLRVPSG